MKRRQARARLIGDIGGTHTRLAVLHAGARPARIRCYDNVAFSGIEAIFETYLAAHRSPEKNAGDGRA